MEAQDESSKFLSQHEIHAPVHSLMRSAFTLETGASTQEAIDLMVSHGVGYVIVVSDHALRGIFSERDVLLKILNKPVGDLTEVPVERFMKVHPRTLNIDDSLDTAISYMASGGYRHIPIVDNQNSPVGLVSIRHIISYLAENFPQEILTLPPHPIRESMKAREGA